MIHTGEALDGVRVYVATAAVDGRGHVGPTY
jgi:hypothetical protein